MKKLVDVAREREQHIKRSNRDIVIFLLRKRSKQLALINGTGQNGCSNKKSKQQSNGYQTNTKCVSHVISPSLTPSLIAFMHICNGGASGGKGGGTPPWFKIFTTPLQLAPLKQTKTRLAQWLTALTLHQRSRVRLQQLPFLAQANGFLLGKLSIS